jgi:hypothetical protein
MSSIVSTLQDVKYSTIKSLILDRSAVSTFIVIDDCIIIKAQLNGFEVMSMILLNKDEYYDFLINIKPISNL